MQNVKFWPDFGLKLDIVYINLNKTLRLPTEPASQDDSLVNTQWAIA